MFTQEELKKMSNEELLKKYYELTEQVSLCCEEVLERVENESLTLNEKN